MKNDSSKADLDSLSSKHSALHSKHAAAFKELDSLRSQERNLEDDDSNADLNSLRSEHTILQTQHTSTLQELDSLKSQLREAQADAVSSNSAELHNDLRRYMATLKRQYGSDVADIESLRRDIDAEGEKRDEAWRKQEEMRAVIAAELEQILGEGNIPNGRPRDDLG